MPPRKANPEKRKEMMNAMGFGEPQTLEDFQNMLNVGDVDNDADLEAELLNLIGGGGGGSSSRAASKPVSNSRPAPAPPARSRPVDTKMFDLSTEDMVDDEDVDIAEDDPELLAELQQFVADDDVAVPTPLTVDSPLKASVSTSIDHSQMVQLITVRIAEYRNKLDNPGGSQPAQLRRFERGLTTLQDCLKKAQRGVVIDEDDLPPPLPKSDKPPPKVPAVQPDPVPERVPPPVAAPVKPAPLSTSTVDHRKEEAVLILTKRQSEYKQAALKARKEGNLDAAKEYLIVSKHFDEAIFYAQQSTEPVDLSDIPPPPSQWVIGTLSQPKEDSDDDEEPEPPTPAAPKKALTLLEALQERKSVFLSQVKKAEEEGNTSKLRRMQRIVGQYDDAIKSCQRKIAFDYNDLVSLPGMDPLPLNAAASAPASGGGGVPAASNASTPVSKQVAFLKERQHQFRAKALECKQRGDIAKAKEYLTKSKGFDSLILAASSGLPVDLSKMPSLTSGGASSSINVATSGVECPTPSDLLTTDRTILLPRLQAILKSQIQKATDTSMALRKMGDAMAAKRMDAILTQCKQECDFLTDVIRRNAPMPKFHFEWRMLPVPNCNNDLAEDEMEFTVVKGINLCLPEGFSSDQLDSYIRTELVFPVDTAAQVLTSEVIKRTNNPEYNASIKFKVVSRKKAAFQRLVKSKVINVDVFYRRGFLKKDGQLGTVPVKLEELEKLCTIEKPFDLMSGRKAIGGTLQVRIRVRESLVGGGVTESRETWLVLDNRSISSAAAPASTSPSKSPESVEVLIYERDLIDQKILQLQDQLTPHMLDTLKQSINDLNFRIATLKKELKDPLNLAFARKYVVDIEPLSKVYARQSQEALQQGQREKAQILLTKKKKVEEEVHVLRTRMK